MRFRSFHLAGAALALVGGAAHASLTLAGPEDFQGTGLGAANTILTIQSPASSSSETGQVPSSNGFDVISGTVAPIPEPGTYTLMLAGLGVVVFLSLRRRRG